LNWNKWVRQTHRWLSIAFTVGVTVNGVAVARGKYKGWVGLLALLPLALLLFTGLYLFVLPYANKWAGGDAPPERAAAEDGQRLGAWAAATGVPGWGLSYFFWPPAGRAAESLRVHRRRFSLR